MIGTLFATGGAKAAIGGGPPTENLVAWYQFNTGITESEGGVSVWADQSGNANDLGQPDDTTRRPSVAAGIITFDGTNDVLYKVFTLNQPYTVYVLMKQVAWASGKYLLDGGVGNDTVVYTGGVSPQIRQYAGADGSLNGDLTVGEFKGLAAVFNGATSILQIGSSGTPTESNAGAQNGGGLSLGANASAAAASNISVKEALVYSVAHDVSTRATVLSYLESL